MKIITVVGARPQFIKAATLSRVFDSMPEMVEILLHTGQHYDQCLSDIFFEELEIPQPRYNLGIGSDNHGSQTGQMLEAIENILLQEHPDWVLVYGDTNSTLAAALAAVKLHISVAHVEAGLRSFNRRMPEEINRVLTDHTADLLFAPTITAVENLSCEGISTKKAHLVGDVMYDAALYYGTKAEQTSTILQQLGLLPKQYMLATVHRAENTNDSRRLHAIFEALTLVASETRVVVPLHPRTYNALETQGILERVSRNLTLIKPVGYLDMVMLEKQAQLIITDSGGVQKEAFFHGVPCATLREETEWVELVKSGWNTLVSPKLDNIEISQMILSCVAQTDQNKPVLYGDGHSAKKILDILSKKQ